MPVSSLRELRRAAVADRGVARRKAGAVRHGAALLEIIVAIVLAGLLFTPLARSTASAFHGYTLASARDRAAALQTHRLGVLRADPCSGSATGDSTVGAAHITWSASPDSGGLRELRAAVNSVAGELEVWGADLCR